MLYLTTDSGNTWSAVKGGEFVPTVPGVRLWDKPYISGPPNNPVIYQPIQRAPETPGTWPTGIIRIDGVRTGTATFTNADTGLNNIGIWCEQFLCPVFAFGVSPSNPQHMMAADANANMMKQSTDGGVHWNPTPGMID